MDAVQSDHEEESSRKKLKLSTTSSFPLDARSPSLNRPEDMVPTQEQSSSTMDTHGLPEAQVSGNAQSGSLSLDETDKERSVGITEFVNASPIGISAVLKKRYTDFLVNEISLTGEVVHLHSLKPVSKALQRTDQLSQPRTISGTNGSQHNEANDQAGSNPDSAAKIPHGSENSAPVKYLAEESSKGAPAPKIRDQHEPAAENVGKEDQPPENPRSQDPKEYDSKSTDPSGPSDKTDESLLSDSSISASDKALLVDYFDKDITESIIQLDLSNQKPQHPTPKRAALPKVFLPSISDRELRTKIHKDIGRIFNGRLDTKTDENGQITVSLMKVNARANRHGRGNDSRNRRENQLSVKLSWEDKGGEYLHFSVYKENKDTMEVVGFIQRQLSTNPRNLQFAGTKDRRAVTVQRMSLYRFDDGRVSSLNRTLRNAKVGDFKYEPRELTLGDLLGNEFHITLRECVPSDGNGKVDVDKTLSLLSERIKLLSQTGFINYYGLQRFGSFTTRTDVIGMMMLKGNYKEACDALTSYEKEVLDAALSPQADNPNHEKIGREDKARAHALFTYKVRGRIQQALKNLPPKFSAEHAIIRHLSKSQSSHDYVGALEQVPRGLRLMYVHAYQSLVWNEAASERWRLYGSKVVEGDLVIKSQAEIDASNPAEEEDENGELVIHAKKGKRNGESPVYEQARPLTREEAASGKFSIFDIVLPGPGFDVIYPSNAVGKFYETFMASPRGGGLNPHDMRRSWKTISLSGNYRHVFARPLKDGNVEVELQEYHDENEQLVQTDLDRLQQQQHKPQAGEAVDEKVTGKNGDHNVIMEEMAASGKATNGTVIDKQAFEARIHAESGVANPVTTMPKEHGRYTAIILKLQLASSQYATMALRELMGPGGIKVHKGDYVGPR